MHAHPANLAISPTGHELIAMANRRLTAILAADVAGYSALMGVDDERTVKDLKNHQSAVFPLVDQHGGRIIDTAGDGVLAEFPSAVEAVRCAVAIQRTVADLNRSVGPDRRLLFRIGVNLGDVIFDEGRIYGDGVNIAARLEGIATPGGICISRSVFEQVASKLDQPIQDLGEKRVKNIAQPVHVFSLSIGGDSKPALQQPAARASAAVSMPAFQWRTIGVGVAVALVVMLAGYSFWLGFGKRHRSDAGMATSETSPAARTQASSSPAAKAKQGADKPGALLASDRPTAQGAQISTTAPTASQPAPAAPPSSAVVDRQLPPPAEVPKAPAPQDRASLEPSKSLGAAGQGAGDLAPKRPASPSQPLDGVWEAHTRGGASCPVKSGRHVIVVQNGVIVSSNPRPGHVGRDGSLKYYTPGRADPGVTVEWVGKLNVNSNIGQAAYRVLGGTCRGVASYRRFTN